MKTTLFEARLTNEAIDKFLRDLICELYGTVYTKNFTITRLWPIGYEVKIPLSNPERPLVIAIEAEGTKYFKLLKRAIQESNLGKASFYTISLNGFTDDSKLSEVQGEEAVAHYDKLEDNLYLAGKLLDDGSILIDGKVKNSTLTCEN